MGSLECHKGKSDFYFYNKKYLRKPIGNLLSLV
jgi:hypothetical protein